MAIFSRIGIQLEILYNKSVLCQVHGLSNHIYHYSSCQRNWLPWNRRLYALQWTWILFTYTFLSLSLSAVHLVFSLNIGLTISFHSIHPSTYTYRSSMWRVTRKICAYHIIIIVCLCMDWLAHLRNFARYFWTIMHQSDQFGRICWIFGRCVMNQMYCFSNTKTWKRI